jgi:hypothetical protein
MRARISFWRATAGKAIVVTCAVEYDGSSDGFWGANNDARSSSIEDTVHGESAENSAKAIGCWRPVKC